MPGAGLAYVCRVVLAYWWRCLVMSVAGTWRTDGVWLAAVWRVSVTLFSDGFRGLSDTHLRAGLIHIENRGFWPISPVSEPDTLDVYHEALIRGNAGFRSVSEVYQSVLRGLWLIHIDTPVIHLLIHF